jgi:hypothetical protein
MKVLLLLNFATLLLRDYLNGQTVKSIDPKEDSPSTEMAAMNMSSTIDDNR